MNPTMRTTLAAACALLAWAGPALAQTTDKMVLSLDGARRVIAAAVAEARKNQTTGVIAVVDDGGHLMALERIDGTFPAGSEIAIGKARTAALFRKPTSAFEKIIREGRTAMVALPDFTPLQGGVPIVVDGNVVGAVGVSGASSAQQDEEFAVAGAAALATSSAGGTSASMGEVSYFESADVSAAFRRGAPLLEVDDFKIHASRREGAGQAEVHARETDVIYVLEGSATFVTGGSVVDGQTTAPDEIRGSSIRGGMERTLGRGDVIVVPRGTPHWFKAIGEGGGFVYYVVKVVEG